jgi:murein DD-endopeptidase MepM/ murein hydrolase activator NlpD
VAQQLPAEVRPVFNLGRIQAGHTLIYTHTASGEPLALTYQIEANRLLRLRPGVPNWTAAIETTPYVTHLVSVAGTVQSSLFGAVEAAGEHDQLALELASIFGWDLDFYTDPRQGDTFRVLVDENFLNGKFSGYGQVVAAEYVNAGTVFDALRFHDAFGQLAYYRPDGHPMKKAFLRSPLKFAAPITSGFSEHRFHPILKTYRAHLGTDFGAPTGTPVQTIGSGTVIRAGRFGGDGNMVQIQHAGGYQTLYLHLSRILVHVGERVAQGERIGLVGMTGLATGPHLDFRIEHNGRFENFEVVRKTLPPAEPVAASLRPQFSALRAELLPKLHALP